MLSIMLMRHRDSGLVGDSADGDIIDRTREWLQASKDHVFQLVVDELHLYRESAGTEVAYLVRLLLDRLALAPSSPQLRILASSASLEGEDAYRFLGQFFGVGGVEETRQRFHVEHGEPLFMVGTDAALPTEIGVTLRKAATSWPDRGHAELAWEAFQTFEACAAGQWPSHLLAAFVDPGHGGDPRLRARGISALARPLVSRNEQSSGSHAGSRGTLPYDS